MLGFVLGLGLGLVLWLGLRLGVGVNSVGCWVRGEGYGRKDCAEGGSTVHDEQMYLKNAIIYPYTPGWIG